MTFELSARPAYFRGSKFVKISYDGVTFDDALFNEGELHELATELLQAAVELDPHILNDDKVEFHSEGVRQCCDWLRKEGHGELADKMINYV